MNNVVEVASASAIAVIKKIQEHASAQEDRVRIHTDSIQIYKNVFNAPEYEWRLLAKLAMLSYILQKPFDVRLDDRMPVPYIDAHSPASRDEVFLGLNTQVFNFLSGQPNIANHCVMFRVADNDINAQRPAYAELLNMYTNGLYHSTKYERDTLMYLYHAGQIEFELQKFDDTHRVAIVSKYEQQYANDLNAIIANIRQEFPK